jgi:hypothetical protein
MIGIGFTLQRFIDEEMTRYPTHDLQDFGIGDIPPFEVMLNHPLAGLDDLGIFRRNRRRGGKKKNPG